MRGDTEKEEIETGKRKKFSFYYQKKKPMLIYFLKGRWTYRILTVENAE